MKVSEHFDIREFISKATWERSGEDSIKLIDKRLIDTTIAIGKTCGVWGVIICGGVKTFSKFFGIPLKDIH